MNISLDYDDTYTRDPKMWDRIIATMQGCGHRVYCVTMRYPREADEYFQKSIAKCVDAVHFTERRGKEAWCRENGVHIDVWIDDSPAWLVRDAL